MEICQDLPRPDTIEMKRTLLGDGTRAKAAQDSKLRANKGLGVKGNKSLKRHISNPDTKLQYNQGCTSLGSLRIISNGNKFSQIEADSKVRMGDLVQEQGYSNLRQDDCSDKSCADRYSMMVRGKTEQRLEAPISYNSNKNKNRESGFRPPNMGLNPQSVVEVPHGHPSSILGSSGDLEQVKKAISDAPLQQIKMDYPRKEDFRFQRGGNNSYGESSKYEIGPDSRASPEMRSATLLQGGYYGNPQVYGDMETNG